MVKYSHIILLDPRKIVLILLYLYTMNKNNAKIQIKVRYDCIIVVIYGLLLFDGSVMGFIPMNFTSFDSSIDFITVVRSGKRSLIVELIITEIIQIKFEHV